MHILTVEDWKTYIWIDNMSIKVSIERTTRDWVWRKDNKEFYPDCIDYRKCSTSTKMMF